MEVPANHDLLTWLVPNAASMHRRIAVDRDGKTAYERNVGRRPVPPLAQFGERVWWMPLQPSNRLWIHDLNKEGTWDRWMDRTRYLLDCKWSGKGPNNQTMPPSDSWTGNLLDEALGSEQTPMMAVELGSERLCCNHTRQFLCHHWRLKFDRCDERHCAELTLSNLDTQTIAPDVPTQEQFVNKRWIIRNSAHPAWKQSCRRPPKVTND